MLVGIRVGCTGSEMQIRLSEIPNTTGACNSHPPFNQPINQSMIDVEKDLESIHTSIFR